MPKHIPVVQLLGPIHCHAAAREDGEHLEGLLDLRECRHPCGFENALAFLHVSHFTAIGDKKGFVK